MKRKIIIIVGILTLLGIGVAFYLFNKTHQDTGRLEADYTMPADSLILAFEKDEAEANIKFVDKVLEVEGEVASVNVNARGTANISLTDALAGVSCLFDSTYVQQNKALFENLQEGTRISIKGVCAGKLIDVKLTRCIVLNIP